MEKTNSYTDEDLTATPWCYMPPEMHFNSPTEMVGRYGMMILFRWVRGQILTRFH